MFWTILAQTTHPAPSSGTTGPDASTIFYLTLLFIFLTAIVTTLITKWARDKCLKFFDGYHVTLERARGQSTWGIIKTFSSGLEIIYDHPFIDVHGRKKTSYLMYQSEVETQVLSLLRYHDELTPTQQKLRQLQIEQTFNPGPFKRLMRSLRNLINTLRDAFNAAMGAAVGQYQKSTGSAILGAQSGQVTQIGQQLLGKIANAYEPLLEQYIGQPVIMDVVDPLNPNNATVEHTGYLADYTQQFIAIFNVEHSTAEELSLMLPDVEAGDKLPPLPLPPAIGAPPIVLPPALKEEHGLAVRIDGSRFRIQNTRSDCVIIRGLEREGFERVALGAAIAPNATFDLPARDAQNARLILEVIRCLDIVAPRKYATIRHAGELVEKRGFADEIGLSQLPLVPKILHGFGEEVEEVEDDKVTG